MVDITKKHKQFFATALQTTEFRKKWGFHQWICQKKSLLMTVIEAALKLCFWWSKYSWSILLCCCSGKLPQQRHFILYFQPVMSSFCSCAWHRVWNEMILKVSSIPNHSMVLWSAFVLKVNKGRFSRRTQHKGDIRILPILSITWNAERSRRITWIWRLWWIYFHHYHHHHHCNSNNSFYLNTFPLSSWTYKFSIEIVVSFL